jgi:hypothetical protein
VDALPHPRLADRLDMIRILQWLCQRRHAYQDQGAWNVVHVILQNDNSDDAKRYCVLRDGDKTHGGTMHFNWIY